MKTMKTMKTSILLDKKQKKTLEVEFKLSPAGKRHWYLKNGDPGYPPEPAEVEIISVKYGACDITEMLQFNFFSQMWERIEKECLFYAEVLAPTYNTRGKDEL